MAQKRLNNVNPGVKRPLQVSDLQDIWDGITDLAVGTQGAPRVIAGMDISGTTVSQGLIAFNGGLYLTQGAYTVGQSLYAHEDAGESRSFGDNTTQVFNYVRTADTSATNGTLIGQMTLANLILWKTRGIPAGGIVGAMLASGAVGTDALATACVTNDKVANGLSGSKLLNTSIPDSKIISVSADKITGELDPSAIPTDTFTVSAKIEIGTTGSILVSETSTTGEFAWDNVVGTLSFSSANNQLNIPVQTPGGYTWLKSRTTCQQGNVGEYAGAISVLLPVVDVAPLALVYTPISTASTTPSYIVVLTFKKS